jgi:hypothetical protein
MVTTRRGIIKMKKHKKLIIYCIYIISQTLQVRYQQKVMQESAQKKTDMYGLDDTQKLMASSLGKTGKVSQFFI